MKTNEMIHNEPVTATGMSYDPAEAAQIVRHLTDGYFDPEYILLFGKLAGGTPHSDVAAYDIMMVVRDLPEYDWMQAKRILKYKMPCHNRRIAYINPYIIPLNIVDSCRTPFIYLAHAEGHLLYCNERHCFRRPRRPIDFGRACADARSRYGTLASLGKDLLEQAQEAMDGGGSIRMAALLTAQAAAYLYHALHYAYHNAEFGSDDLVVMHDRMRTLSAKLMLLFDDSIIKHSTTVQRLRGMLTSRARKAEFGMSPQEMETHLNRVRKAAGIIEQIAERRFEIYRNPH